MTSSSTLATPGKRLAELCATSWAVTWAPCASPAARSRWANTCESPMSTASAYLPSLCWRRRLSAWRLASSPRSLASAFSRSAFWRQPSSASLPLLSLPAYCCRSASSTTYGPLAAGWSASPGSGGIWSTRSCRPSSLRRGRWPMSCVPPTSRWSTCWPKTMFGLPLPRGCRCGSPCSATPCATWRCLS